MVIKSGHPSMRGSTSMLILLAFIHVLLNFAKTPQSKPTGIPIITFSIET